MYRFTKNRDNNCLAQAKSKVSGVLLCLLISLFGMNISWATDPVMSPMAAQILGANPEPDICWKDSYGRGVGQVPSACPSGWERTGADLLCYPKCKAGFKGVGPVCWQDCPANFRNDGAMCAKPAAYGRGAGFPWVFGDPLSDAGMFKRCEAANGRGNCEKNGAVVYPKCKTGFRNVGCCVCSPSCPAGMVDTGTSCIKQSEGRGVGKGATCAVGTEQDLAGGLCYPQCKQGSAGVGPVCWSSCPKDFPVNCGAACGVNQASCAFAILEQVQLSTEVVLNVALLVTTAGAGNAGIKAAKLGGKSVQKNLTNQAKNQLRDQAKQQALKTRQWLQQQKNVKRAQDMATWLEQPANVDMYANNMLTVYEKGEFDFTQLVPSAADFDPTGVLGVVNAFNKPICKP